MLAMNPWRIWPLRIIFFTELALKNWNTVNKSIDLAILPLPPGFSFVVELEGVDGRSGHAGSGRFGPIDVTDSRSTHFATKPFTKSHK